MSFPSPPLLNGSAARQSDREHLTWIDDYAVTKFEGRRVLDLGCGSGYLCAHARSRGAHRAVGIDILRPEVDPAGKYSWEFIEYDLDRTDWHLQVTGGEGAFDRVFAFDILEHVRSPVDLLSGCRSLLAEDGIMVLTTPNISSWERFLRPRSWSGVRDPQHKILFSSYSLRFLLNRMGFEPVITKCPIRSLRRLGALGPQLGGQIFSVSRCASR